MQYELHGMSDTPEYLAYKQAKARCQSTKDHLFPYYGAKGITFEFTSFLEFYKEVGKRPTTAHSLDRIDNTKGYEPGNVKWSTKSEQLSNRDPYERKLRTGKGYSRRGNRYIAEVRFKGERYYIGVFDTEASARIAYETKLHELREGESR